MDEFESVAISSRVRLARNVAGFNFFTKLTNESDAEFILNSIENILNDFGDFDFIRLKKLSLNECNALLERHIISKELIENKDISAVAISSDEHLIVMMNEEDHIRAQCIYNGFNLFKPYREIKALDEKLLTEIDIAYNDNLGFITASPSNLGTGMRASVMLFLPALERRGELEIMKKEVLSNNCTIRGLYGEGSQNYGGFYQISNQNSLGKSEEEILDEVSDQIYSICEMEMSAREDILSSDHLKLKDEIYRAYGVLKECAMLDEVEMIKLLSLVKFGGALGFFKINEKEFEKLFYEGSSANLKELTNFFDLKKEEALRAEYINKKIGELVAKDWFKGGETWDTITTFNFRITLKR